MNLVALLTPDNKLLKATYPKLRNICIKECLKEENIEQFMEFQKEYSYFEPYFDFMFFRKKYLLLNPLYVESSVLGEKNGELYLVKITEIDYEKIRRKLEQINTQEQKIFITQCSDRKLQLKKASVKNIGRCLVDSNLISMMNVPVDSLDSHMTTANTILNQVMIRCPEIAKDFLEEIRIQPEYYNDYPENLIIDYVCRRLGCLRITDNLVIYSTTSITEETQELLGELLIQNYQGIPIMDFKSNKIKEYKKILKKEEMKI